MGHIFRNCEFSVGLTLTGLVSAGNYDIQFIDCIIRGLTLTATFFSVYGGSFFRRCNFKYQSINALQSNIVDLMLEDCVNIPDDLETISPKYFVNGSAQYVNDHYYLNSAKKYYLTTNFVDITPTLDYELTSKFYVDTEINTKHDTITSATDLDCNSITASSAIVNSVDIGSGFTSLQTQVDALIEYITNVGFRALVYLRIQLVQETILLIIKQILIRKMVVILRLLHILFHLLGLIFLHLEFITY
jgi:hypothetical protein